MQCCHPCCNWCSFVILFARGMSRKHLLLGPIKVQLLRLLLTLSKVLCSRLFFSCSLLQAILFYVPRWLWKNWEAGKVAALRMDLNLGIISEVEKKLKKKLLIEYMYSNLKHHNFWASSQVGQARPGCQTAQSYAWAACNRLDARTCASV